MSWGSMHLGGPSFFSVVEGGKVSILDFFFVGFNVFPWGSHEVFNVFSTCSPNSQCVHYHVPNGSSFYCISFALSSILVTYVSSPKEISTYIFWECTKVDYFILFYFIFKSCELQSLIKFWPYFSFFKFTLSRIPKNVFIFWVTKLKNFAKEKHYW